MWWGMGHWGLVGLGAASNSVERGWVRLRRAVGCFALVLGRTRCCAWTRGACDEVGRARRGARCALEALEERYGVPPWLLNFPIHLVGALRVGFWSSALLYKVRRV